MLTLEQAILQNALQRALDALSDAQIASFEDDTWQESNNMELLTDAMDSVRLVAVRLGLVIV